jgi:hypothetical protein
MFASSMGVVGGISYPVFDPSHKGPSIALTNSNRTANASTGSSCVLGTKAIPPSSDKYWEVHIDNTPTSVQIGIAQGSTDLTTYPSVQASAWVYLSNGFVATNGASAGFNGNYGSGDVVGVRYNSGTGALSFYLNGILQTYGFTGLSGSMFPVFGASAGQVTINFGPAIPLVPSGASMLAN